MVELKPDHAEAWNRRAYVHFQMNNYTAAVGDLVIYNGVFTSTINCSAVGADNRA